MKWLSEILNSAKKKECIEGNLRGDTQKQSTDAEKYVNLNNFSSDTNYFIWVDLKNFKVNIFEGTTNKWKMLHSYLCTIGNACPTK